MIEGVRVRFHRLKATGVGVLVVIAMAGCASSTPVASQDEASRSTVSQHAPATSTPTLAVTPTPTATPAVIDETWTTEEGYQYTVLMIAGEMNVVTDVADAQPGQAVLKVTQHFSGTAMNTTGGHDAPYPDLVVDPVWTGSSPVCSIHDAGNIHFSAAGTEAAPNVCELDPTSTQPALQPRADATSSQIPAGKTVPVIADLRVNLTVPEKQANAFAAALQHPDAYVFARSNGKTLCLAQNGYYVSTSNIPVSCGHQ